MYIYIYAYAPEHGIHPIPNKTYLPSGFIETPDHELTCHQRVQGLGGPRYSPAEILASFFAGW